MTSQNLEHETIVIRPATDADQPALELLAELDSRRVPAGPVLVGELRSQPVAALSMSSGELITNHFQPTAEMTELLRLRARQLSLPPRRRLLPSLRRRLTVGWPQEGRLAIDVD